MKTLTRKAYGKINIGLDVTGQRSDGYHLVRMIMQTVDIYDLVRVTVSEGSGQILLSCDNPDIPADESNLAWISILKRRYPWLQGWLEAARTVQHVCWR